MLPGSDNTKTLLARMHAETITESAGKVKEVGFWAMVNAFGRWHRSVDLLDTVFGSNVLGLQQHGR